MTDGPQQCALPGCSAVVEQPADGGPPRRYCTPAHRVAARKQRHAARVETAATTQEIPLVSPQDGAGQNGAAQAADTRAISASQADGQPTATPATDTDTEPATGGPSVEPAAAAASTPEPPAPLAAPAPPPEPKPDRKWSPVASWTVSPTPLPPVHSGPRVVKTITSHRVKTQKPARTAADRKSAATAMCRRAVASVAIASLVAGGASYIVTENVVPTTPTTVPPPQAAPQPAMEADVWAERAEVVLASINKQLETVAQTEARWQQLPEPRRVQSPEAVQALQNRKALLEQQRATLASQLEALRALPELTTELSAAQAQLDAVERTLQENSAATSSRDHQEAIRQLEEQRELHRQQRDHTVQALADLRDGVEQALSSPLPDEEDRTTPIVQRVRELIENPDRDDDSGAGSDADSDTESLAAGSEPAANQRRDEDGDERSDVGVTAPPDPEQPGVAALLADGGRGPGSSGGNNGNMGRGPAEQASEGRQDNGSNGERRGPVRGVTSALGDTVDRVLPGGVADSDRSDKARSRNQDDDRDRSDRRASWGDRDKRGDDDKDDKGHKKDDKDDDRGSLGGVVRGVLGGSDDDDRDKDDDRDRGNHRDRDDRADKRDKSHKKDDKDDDRDRDRGNHRDQDDRDDDDDRGRGEHRDRSDRNDERADRKDNKDGDESASERRRPVGKAERERNRIESQLREAAERLTDGDDRDDEKSDSDKEKASGDSDGKKKSDDSKDKKKSDDSNGENKSDDSDNKKKSDDSNAKNKSDDSDNKKKSDDSNAKNKSDDSDGKKKSDDSDNKDSDNKDSGDKDSGDKDSDSDDSGDSDSGDSDD